MIRKRLILLLMLVLALVLAACDADKGPASASGDVSTAAVATEPAPVEPAPVEPPKPPVGLVELQDIVLQPGEYPIAQCCQAEEAAILLSRWDESADAPEQRLVLIDRASAAVKNSFPANAEIEEGFSDIALEPERIVLYNNYTEYAVFFSRDGRFLGEGPYPTLSQENKLRGVRLIDSSFYSSDSYAMLGDDTGYGPGLCAVILYADPEALYLMDSRERSIVGCAGRKLALFEQTEGGPLYLSLLDTETGGFVDRTELRAGDTAVRSYESYQFSIAPDWALLSLAVQEEAEFTEVPQYHFYLWYLQRQLSEPAPITRLEEQELRQELDALAAGMAADYGLVFHLDEAPAMELTPTIGLSSSENECQTGASLYGQYRVLFQLRSFLELLPPGFSQELPNRSEDADGRLHIYIVRDIPGDAAAFANAWAEPMMVCFATEEFGCSHLPHEFQHLTDRRLTAALWEQDRDFEAEWAALSPENAYYDAETEPDWDYFVSWYAKTNNCEDRAETFQRLFDESRPLSEAEWYQAYPGVAAKTDYLIAALRECFPSVQAVERAYWEKQDVGR